MLLLFDKLIDKLIVMTALLLGGSSAAKEARDVLKDID